MKAVNTVKAILFCGMLLGGTMALAGDGKGSLQLNHATSVAGKQLGSGTYHLQWSGAGDQVELKIFRGKNLVMSTPARVVTRNSPSAYDATMSNTNSDGSSSLSQIRFRGKSYVLEISTPGGGSSAGQAAQ